MPLLSHLFSSDAKLQACAVDDTAHIAQGARGDHVVKIQSALNLVDHATLKTDGIYGPATAAAVLRYKQARNIVNRSYQQQADSIVGKMTIVRLDKDVLAAEQTPDPRIIRCVFRPGGEQHTRSFSVRDAPAEITGFSLLEEARASLPLANAWVAATLRRISDIDARIERFKIYTAEDIDFFSPIQTHFKVNIPIVSENEAKDRLRKIKRMFEKIQRVFALIATDRLVGNPGVPDKALAPLGGFDNTTDVITIGRDFHNSNANMRAAVLIHEGGHFADASCSHAASEQPAPDGSAIEDRFAAAVNPRKLNYGQLDFDLHMQNAYSFAQCAMHNGLRMDKRPP